MRKAQSKKLLSILCISCFALFVGCAPLSQSPGDELRQPILQHDIFVTKDGAELPLKRWSAEDDEERAVIIAVHGFNDYRNAFAIPGSWWMQRGITTYAYDQRGFGETEQTGIWATEELLTSDLASLVKTIRAEKPGKPIYLLGESMGGAVVMTAVTQPDFPKVDGVILSAPAVWGWKSLNFFYRAVLWTSAHVAPGVKPTGNSLKIQASDNIPMLQNLGRDPLFIKKTRLDSVYGLVGLMDNAYDSAEKLTMPVLLLYGANDEVIPKKPVENVVGRLPKSADVVLYQDGWHLLLRDLQASVVWQDVLSWIETGKISSGSQVTELPLFSNINR